MTKHVYLITHDGHKDSTDMRKCAMNHKGLKKLVKEYHEEIFWGTLVKNSILIIEETEEIYFKFESEEGEIVERKIYFYKVPIV